MSVIGGIVPLPSPAEIAAGGNVVPLRKESPTGRSDRGRTGFGARACQPRARDGRPRTEAGGAGAAAGPSSAGTSAGCRGKARGRAPAQHARARPGARTASPPQPTRSARVGCRRRRARRTAHAGRRSRGAAQPTRSADPIGRSRRFPNDRYGHPARAHCNHARQASPHCNHARQVSPRRYDAGDLQARSRERCSRTDVCLGHFPGRSGIRVPAVPGRRAHLPSARRRRETRTSGSLAASWPPSRPAAGELPLVRVDDLQGHESPVEEADGERKARDRRDRGTR